MALYDNLTFVTAEEKLDLFKQLDYTDKIEAEVEMLQYKKHVLNELLHGLKAAPAADRPAIARYLKQDPSIKKFSTSKESLIAGAAVGIGILVGKTLIDAYMSSLGRIKKVLSKDGNFDANDKSGYLPDYDTAVKVLKNCQTLTAAMLSGNPEAIIKTFHGIGVKVKYNAGEKGIAVSEFDKPINSDTLTTIQTHLAAWGTAAATIAGAPFGLYSAIGHLAIGALTRLAGETAQEKGWTGDRHKACSAMVIKIIDGVEKLKGVKSKDIKGADKIFKIGLKVITKTIKYIGRGLASAAN